MRSGVPTISSFLRALLMVLRNYYTIPSFLGAKLIQEASLLALSLTLNLVRNYATDMTKNGVSDLKLSSYLRYQHDLKMVGEDDQTLKGLRNSKDQKLFFLADCLCKLPSPPNLTPNALARTHSPLHVIHTRARRAASA